MSGSNQVVFQNQRSFGPPPGQQAYTTPGTYCWVAPAGVTKVSAVSVSGGAGGGGSLVYTNNLTVVPGNSYVVKVGAGVTWLCTAGFSQFDYPSGANQAGPAQGYQGGVRTGGYLGGNGGDAKSASRIGQGGGGAGGYSGDGGRTTNPNAVGIAGTGGAGGGGGGYEVCNFPSNIQYASGGGGGVGILGQGTSGAGGTLGAANGGGGGSGGTNGANNLVYNTPGAGGAYGGGGGTGVYYNSYCCCSGTWASINYYSGTGQGGAVRIIWPGCDRSFPSTRTVDE